MANGLKTYEKYSVKKDSSDFLIEKSDGTPELGEKQIGQPRLDDATVRLLNSKWKSFLYYYVLVDDDKKKTTATVNADASTAITESLVDRNYSEMLAVVSDNEKFSEKAATMTKKEIVAVIDKIGFDHSECKFALTKHADYTAIVKANINK